MTASTAPSTLELKVKLRKPFAKQELFINSPKKRRVLRCGRRGGKTVGVAIDAVINFCKGRRVLYGAPTADQVDRFWFEVVKALAEPIEAGYLKKNETDHTIGIPGTEVRIKAKTCWNPDTLRGDYADELYLDEWQLMMETAWSEVGAPMLLDNGGNATFIYTPPSIVTTQKQTNKAIDKRHAAKLFKSVQEGTRDPAMWEAFTWTSHDNPHLDRQALTDITQDMTALAFKQEIMAEDIDELPGALFKQAMIDATRRPMPHIDDIIRYVVAVDPGGSRQTSDECGIVAACLAHCDCGNGTDEDGDEHFFITHDRSGHYSPKGWATEAIKLYIETAADRIVAETNHGGDMVEHTIRVENRNVPVETLHASRGKRVRAEPIGARHERGIIHYVGTHPELEDQACSFTGEPGGADDRVDAKVYAVTDLAENAGQVFFGWARA